MVKQWKSPKSSAIKRVNYRPNIKIKNHDVITWSPYMWSAIEFYKLLTDFRPMLPIEIISYLDF